MCHSYANKDLKEILLVKTLRGANFPHPFLAFFFNKENFQEINLFYTFPRKFLMDQSALEFLFSFLRIWRILSKKFLQLKNGLKL